MENKTRQGVIAVKPRRWQMYSPVGVDLQALG